jgi:protein-S-isoprenylcysteine O-methyltransferase Ste14
LAYAGLRLWATLYVGGRKDLALQASGPYALCRNPLYLGSFALAIAVAAFLQDVVFACAVLVVASLYAWLVVPAEERALLARFGEAYREYTASTPRFVPRFRRPAGPAVLEVDTRRFLAEGRRLTRAALFVLVLHAIASARPF